MDYLLHSLFDPSGSSSPVTDDGITSFDADGFTIGTNSTVNTSSSTYSWVMMFIPSGYMEGGSYIETVHHLIQ